MTLNNEVHVQHETSERTRLLLILNCIRRNVRSHRKERDEKEDVTISQNKTDNKRRHVGEPRTRIPKETMNIPGRQEQKKRQIISKVEL